MMKRWDEMRMAKNLGGLAGGIEFEQKPRSEVTLSGLPAARGLYDPANEHDACGIGFIANIHNRKSHRIILDGLKILCNLEHRGAVGADPKAGDGAGILIQLPDAFLRKVMGAQGVDLPEEGHYGVGQLFMPRQEDTRQAIEKILCGLGSRH